MCTQYSWYIVGFHRFYTPIFGQMHLDTAQLGYSRTGWSTTKIKPKSAVPWVSIRLSTTSNYYIHDGKSHYISGWDINGILHDISVVSGIVMGHPPLYSHIFDGQEWSAAQPSCRSWRPKKQAVIRHCLALDKADRPVTCLGETQEVGDFVGIGTISWEYVIACIYTYINYIHMDWDHL